MMDRNRYTTPPEIVDRVIRVWPDGPDLDPFWDPYAAITAKTCVSIRADDAGEYDDPRGRFAVVHGDGFGFEWAAHDRVWCQPPYSRGNVGRALEKCAEHRARGGQCIALVNVGTATRYWREHVYPAASCIVFPRRISFHYRGRPQRGNEHQQAVIYYGADVRAFLRGFGDMSPAWHLDIRSRQHWTND